MRRIFLAALTAPAWLAWAAAAQAAPAVDVHAGTLGGGLGVAFGVIPHRVDLRVGFNTFNYSRTFNSGTVDYDGKVRFENAGALVDLFPFDGTFRLSLGLYYNNNKFDLTGKPNASGTYSINGPTYTVSQVGSLDGTVSFDNSSPYIGLGFGNPMRGGHVTFMFDVGAIYQGSPHVTLTATGALANPQLASDLSVTQQTTQTDMAKFRWWPVIQFGVGFRF